MFIGVCTYVKVFEAVYIRIVCFTHFIIGKFHLKKKKEAF